METVDPTLEPKAKLIIGNLDFEKAATIICRGTLASEQLEGLRSENRKLIISYETLFERLDAETPDPEYNKSLHKQTFFRIVIQNELHFNTLKQYPTDWLNVDLFGNLWGCANLIRSWDHLNSSHRVKHLVHLFKVQAGQETPLTATELRRISENRYKQSLTLSEGKGNRAYRPASKKELEEVIDLLSNCPDAKKFAINALKKAPH